MGALVVAFWGVPGAAAASLEHQMSFRYPHVWRGITLREFPVASVATTASFGKGFHLNLWAGMDLGDGDGRAGEVQEIDIDLYYQRTVGEVSLRAGYIALIFPDGIETTGEAYLQVGVERSLSALLEIYYNVDLLSDYFILLNLGKGLSLTPAVDLTLTGTLGYSGLEYARFFGGRESGFHHGQISLDTSWKLRDLTLTLRLAHTENLREEVLENQPVSTWGGFYLTFRP